MTKHETDTPTIITCGLPYANGDLHIGHLRGLFAGDTYKRGVEIVGGDAIYVSATDTHGTPIALEAEGTDSTPREIALEYHAQFEDTLSRLSIELDNYTHTDTDLNKEVTNEVVTDLQDAGYIEETTRDVPVDTETDFVLPDRYVVGECPNCGETARGDECESCQEHLEPDELKNPRSKNTGNSLEYEPRPHKNIQLQNLEKDIQEFKNSVDGNSQVSARIGSWLDSGLRPWCVTRDIDWGFQDPDNSDRVFYVWIDALSGYISASKELTEELETDVYDDVWSGDGDVVHIVGKDIIHHHAVLWPALLSQTEYSNPSSIVASGFVTLDGEALSTSRNHAVWALEYLNTGYNPEFLRYYLLAKTGFNSDVDFTWDEFRKSVNSKLIDSVGNLFRRISSICDGVSISTDPSEEVQEEVSHHISQIESSVQNYDIHSLSRATIELASYGNSYIQQTKPWSKSGEEKQQILSNLSYILRVTVVASYPILPETAPRVWKQLTGQNTLSIESQVLSDIPLEQSISEVDVPFEKL